MRDNDGEEIGRCVVGGRGTLSDGSGRIGPDGLDPREH